MSNQDYRELLALKRASIEAVESELKKAEKRLDAVTNALRDATLEYQRAWSEAANSNDPKVNELHDKKDRLFYQRRQAEWNVMQIRGRLQREIDKPVERFVDAWRRKSTSLLRDTQSLLRDTQGEENNGEEGEENDGRDCG